VVYFLSFSEMLLEHKDGIVSMAASVNGNDLLTVGGDELICLWHWNKTAPHLNANKAGFQTARSQLDACNFIH
jgi:WD40 repeat protein